MPAKKTLITAALPYANGPLHFGHIAGAYLPADVYARYKRLKQEDVLFICGSDEFGVAITISAEAEKRTPKEHVDLYHAVNKGFFDQLNISFDHYSRTTCRYHPAIVQKFFLDLYKKGYIEERITDQLYSPKESRFLADRYVKGTCKECGYTEARGDECPKCGASYESTDLIDPKSKISGDSLILKPTKHWFLKFDLFKERLTDWIAGKKWKANVTNFAMRYIQDLRPRAITRDGEWGIPVPLPGAEGKVLYVWFDAPIGYISATMEWADTIAKNKDAWKKYWQDPETTLVHFVGKDNIPFHAVFFPAMTMGQDDFYKLVDELPANEFYNLEGKQFSKSEGWYIDLKRFFERFSPDQIRYAIASNAPESQDSEFTWKDFQSKCNADLLGKYGNFANRVLVFAENHCGGVVPPLGHCDEKDRAFQETMERLVKEIGEAYAGFSLRRACQHLMELCQAGNVYFDMKKPWALAKTKEQEEALHTAINLCLECLKKLTIVSSPLIPTASQKLWEMLGHQGAVAKLSWDSEIQRALPTRRKLSHPTLLFTRIENEPIQEEIEILKKQVKEKPVANPGKAMIDFQDFQKLDLRVAEIQSVERVPKSKKLLKLIICLGEEKRTIVAGIGEKMENIETLIGKKIVVVANLKPTTIMGVESQGMLLAARGENLVEPLMLEHVESGCVVS